MRLAHNGNIDPFLSEMGRIPLLTAAEEITLGSVVQLARSPEATPSPPGILALSHGSFRKPQPETLLEKNPF